MRKPTKSEALVLKLFMFKHNLYDHINYHCVCFFLVLNMNKKRYRSDTYKLIHFILNSKERVDELFSMAGCMVFETPPMFGDRSYYGVCSKANMICGWKRYLLLELCR